MASEKQIEANRRNALKSTGPRTEEGKAVVSRNAIRHGLTAQSAVVVPFLESEEDWEAHRLGTLESLRPEGHLETVLAERVALQLWRLGRVTRYEREHMTREIERAEAGIVQSVLGGNSPDHLRKRHEENQKLLRLLAVFPSMKDEHRLEGEDAGVIIREVVSLCQNFKPQYDDAPYVPAASNVEDFEDWTVGRVRETLAAIAAREGKTADELLATVADSAEYENGEIKALLEEGARLFALAKRTRSLPDPVTRDNLSRYEAQIDRSLYKTIHELKRLQADRRGRAVIAPIVVDITGDGDR